MNDSFRNQLGEPNLGALKCTTLTRVRFRIHALQKKLFGSVWNELPFIIPGTARLSSGGSGVLRYAKGSRRRTHTFSGASQPCASCSLTVDAGSMLCDAEQQVSGARNAQVLRFLSQGFAGRTTALLMNKNDGACSTAMQFAPRESVGSRAAGHYV